MTIDERISEIGRLRQEALELEGRADALEAETMLADADGSLPLSASQLLTELWNFARMADTERQEFIRKLSPEQLGRRLLFAHKCEELAATFRDSFDVPF